MAVAEEATRNVVQMAEERRRRHDRFHHKSCRSLDLD
jgi:hypothetical protein